jgi:hypothetical protein
VKVTTKTRSADSQEARSGRDITSFPALGGKDGAHAAGLINFRSFVLHPAGVAFIDFAGRF